MHLLPYDFQIAHHPPRSREDDMDRVKESFVCETKYEPKVQHNHGKPRDIFDPRIPSGTRWAL